MSMNKANLPGKTNHEHSPHLQRFSVELNRLFNVALLPLDVGQVVERVGVCWTQT